MVTKNEDCLSTTKMIRLVKGLPGEVAANALRRGLGTGLELPGMSIEADVVEGQTIRGFNIVRFGPQLVAADPSGRVSGPRFHAMNFVAQFS